MFVLSIDKQIRTAIPGAAFSLIMIADMQNSRTPETLWQNVQSISEEYRMRPEMMTGAVEPVMMQVRRMYHAFGMDPTKNRPASERLVRRVLQSKELYRINTAVDVCNAVSLKYRLPLGLFDADALSGKTLTLRFGSAGESYDSLSGREIQTEGKFIIADTQGPIGSPSTDSQRTKITGHTQSVLCLVYGPAGLPETYVQETGDTFGEWCVTYGGGRIVQNDLIAVNR